MGWIESTTRKRPAPPELAALQWMVRVFFVLFAVLRLLAVCGIEVSLAGELSVLVGGLLVIAHMAATVIGTTRRNAAPDEPHAEREAWQRERRRLAESATGAVLPKPTALHVDLPAGTWSLACAAFGAIAAATLAAAATFPAWLRIGLGGVVILELSAATIGGYFGYMTARLTATLRKAWTEATGDLSTAASER